MTSFDAEDYADENTVLVAVGTEEQFERVEVLTRSAARRPQMGPIVITGHGITGTTAEGIPRKAGPRVTTIDAEPDNAVDVVGDVTNIKTLNEAGVDETEIVILALPDDEETLLATLVASLQTRDVNRCNPHTRVVRTREDLNSGNGTRCTSLAV